MQLKVTIVIALFIGTAAAWIDRIRAGDQAAPTPQPPAASQSSQTPPAPQSGAELLQRAILDLEAKSAVSANVRQEVEMFGQRLEGTGSYQEQRSRDGLELRLELRFPLAKGPFVLMQICSGRYLWRYESYRETTRIGRIDLARVFQALEEKGKVPKPGTLGDWPGLGGLPKLLRSLNGAFQFSAAEPAELAGGFPATRLRGNWRPEWLAGLLPEQAAMIKENPAVALQKLPERFPHEVLIYLGRDDRFPYRIEYWRHTEAGGATRPAKSTIMAAIEFYQVVVNVPIPHERFQYDPGNSEYAEHTDNFLEMLGLKK